MKILELLISISIGYFFNYNYGISTFLILKGLFSNNYKMSLFMLMNFLIYSFLGPSYIIFAKFYLMSIVGIFFYDKIYNLLNDKENNNDNDENNKSSLLNTFYNKFLDFYSFINLLISIPFYILYDNLYNILNKLGYTQVFMENNLVKKVNKNLDIYDKISSYDKNKFNLLDFEDINKLDKLENYEDDELDALLTNMLNPKSFIDMANEMRETMGKKKLTENELDDKMKEFSPFLEMFGSPLDNFIKDNKINKKMNIK